MMKLKVILAVCFTVSLTVDSGICLLSSDNAIVTVNVEGKLGRYVKGVVNSRNQASHSFVTATFNALSQF